MAHDAATATGQPLSPTRAVLYGTLVVGVLDGLDAIIFFGLRGASPVRIFQGIASGLLGREAVNGGLPVAALGVLLHFFIAFLIVGTYFLASRKIGVLTRRPIICGALYGVLAYLVMNLVVLPLSATGGGGIPSMVGLINGVLIHVIGVGIPSALFARAARGEDREELRPIREIRQAS